MVPVHHKNDCQPCGERTIFTDDNFLSEKYNLWVESRERPALHMYSCDSLRYRPYEVTIPLGWASEGDRAPHFRQRILLFLRCHLTVLHGSGQSCVMGCICDLQCVQNWPSTKRVSITSLVPWNHDLPQLVGHGGFPWVVPLHFGQRITMDFVMSVAVHSRG